MSDTYTDDKLIQRCLHDRIILQEGELDGIDFLLHTLQPGLKILDVGCGPGTIAFQASPFLKPAGYVIGIDISHETLQSALLLSKKIANTEFIRGTAYNLPFHDSYFDAVYFRHLLMHLEDIRKSIHEAIRVTRDGGDLIALEGDIETWGYYPRFAGWEGLFQIVRQKLGTGTAGRQLWSIFKEIGLIDVRISVIPNVAIGDEFRNHILKWLEVFQHSYDYIIEKNIYDKDLLDNALSEGNKLLHHPFGFFFSLEYKVSGRKI
jgi:SAM-dependent methyltransferase